MSKYYPNINRRLLPVKIHFFLFFAAIGFALPYRTIFAKQLGISATAIGIMFTAVPFFRIVTNPLFGFILDYFKRFRLTITVITIFMALSYIAMTFIPPKSSDDRTNTRVIENNFRFKIKYSCLNENISSTCDPNIVFYSKHRVTDDIVMENISSICDIHCFKSTDGRDITKIIKEKNIQKCNQILMFEFQIGVDFFGRALDIKLKSGSMKMLEKGSWNPVLNNLNESLTKLIESHPSNFGNYSEEITNGKILLQINGIEREKNTGKNVSAFAETFDKDYKLSKVTESFKNKKKWKYVANEFKFDMLGENFRSNDSCSMEFECQTKTCENNFKVQLKSENVENEFLSAQFWTLFLLIALSGILFTTIIFMMDAVCYELLQDKRNDYGQQRLWGTIGWGMGALAGGFLNQAVTTDPTEINYAPSFYALAIISVIDLIPICQVKVTDLKYSTNIWKDVSFLFSKIDIVYNVIIVFFIGLLSGFIWNYQFWFMQEIGASQVLLGLSQIFECIFELPWFLASGWIIQLFGHSKCNSITLLCFGLRYLCFVFMYDPWWTLAAALFHGPTFGLFYASMTMYGKKKAPPGTEATIQSLLNFCFDGLGIGTGNILGGICLDKFGSRVTFTYAAALSFVILLINILIDVSFVKTKKIDKRVKEFILCK